MLEFIKCRAPLKRVCSPQQLKDLLAKMKLCVIHAQKGNHTQPSYSYALPTHEDALGLSFQATVGVHAEAHSTFILNLNDSYTLYFHIIALN